MSPAQRRVDEVAGLWELKRAASAWPVVVEGLSTVDVRGGLKPQPLSLHQEWATPRRRSPRNRDRRASVVLLSGTTPFPGTGDPAALVGIGRRDA